MKLGIMPPYRGTDVANPDWVRAFCSVLEAEEVESTWAVEHVVVPAAYHSTYPYDETGRMPLRDGDPIPDPLEWISFGAGATTRLIFGTAVLILPEHNPVHLAKRLATIDVLSGGRVLLGIGVGWLEEEFDAVGVPFADRGARVDEYVAAMRVLWNDDVATFDGRFTAFSEVSSRPRPVRAGGVPIIVGGHSPAAARRAGRLGDGFYPFGIGPTELIDLLAIMRDAATKAGRDPDGIEITTTSPRDAEAARQLADVGVSRFVLSARPDSSAEMVRETIGRYRSRVLDALD
jgi:probable F420-dependent oxidoreductase